MKHEEVIALAREAGVLEPVEMLESNPWRQELARDLVRFANLVLASRKPLGRQDLVRIELGLRKYHDGDRYDLSLHDFARAIEAAHGIGGKT